MYTASWNHGSALPNCAVIFVDSVPARASINRAGTSELASANTVPSTSAAGAVSAEA
ncbi:MAG: hypothetical protein II008_16110 [Oscillospiraceae bacterium]|nr:hypothetical protein [Oscillospiraceae bacterium]